MGRFSYNFGVNIGGLGCAVVLCILFNLAWISVVIGLIVWLLRLLGVLPPSA